MYYWDFNNGTDWVDARTPLETPRGELGQAVCTESYIYVVGGAVAADGTLSSEVNAYEVATGQWFTGPPLPIASEVYPVLVGDSAIMVAGGEGNVEGREVSLSAAFMLIISPRLTSITDNLQRVSQELEASSVGGNAPIESSDGRVTSSGGGGGGGRSGGEVFGIIVGVLALIAAVGAAGYFAYRRFTSSKNLSFHKYDQNDPNAGAGMGSA